MIGATLSSIPLDRERVSAAANALGVPRTVVRSLLSINRADRVTILTAAANLVDEALGTREGSPA